MNFFQLQDELALDQRVGTVATTTSGSGGMEVDISDVNQSPTEQLLSDEDDDIVSEQLFYILARIYIRYIYVLDHIYI